MHSYVLLLALAFFKNVPSILFFGFVFFNIRNVLFVFFGGGLFCFCFINYSSCTIWLVIYTHHMCVVPSDCVMVLYIKPSHNHLVPHTCGEYDQPDGARERKKIIERERERGSHWPLSPAGTGPWPGGCSGWQCGGGREGPVGMVRWGRGGRSGWGSGRGLLMSVSGRLAG